MHPLCSQVQANIKRKNLFHGIDKLVVGFSGGADSTALLLLLHKLFPVVKAVHLHHGIRGSQADDDQMWCQKLCSQYDISLTVEYLCVPQKKNTRESIEMAARRLRLAYWTRVLENKKETALTLGHHLDDRIETFFIRMLRGSNASGLSGLKERFYLNGITVIRPLLDISKQELISFLKDEEITTYCHDHTNEDTKYLRNHIRKWIPGFLDSSEKKQGLVKSLDFLAQDADFIEQTIQRKFDSYPSGKIPKKLFEELDVSLWSRFLRKWIYKDKGVDHPIRGSILRNIIISLSRTPKIQPQKLDLSEHYFLQVGEKFLSIEEKREEISSRPIVWKWKENPCITIPIRQQTLTATIIPSKECYYHKESSVEYWDENFLEDSFIIRQRQPGDRMIPFGMKHKVRVKKILSASGLSQEAKKHIILICHPGGEILWIPGIRRSSKGFVHSGCQRCVKLHIKL